MLEPSDTDMQEKKEPEQNENDTKDALTTPGLPTFPDTAVAGFLDNFKLELTHVSQELRSLTDEQNKLLDKVGEHNGILQSNPDMAQLLTVMDEMKGGMDRLNKLKQEMATVHERSERLKGRAEKLEAFCKTAQKKEDDLVAKMEKPPVSNDEP